MPPVKPSQGVDTHAHVFSADAPPVPGARYRPRYAGEIAAWRAQWPGAGITRGVVVQPSFFGMDNREMLETVGSDPKRLRGVAVLDPLADAATLERFHARGVRAIRINVSGAQSYERFATPSWRTLFDRVHARGWHVEVFVDAGRLPDIAAIFEGSAVDVVFDHFGNPGRDARAADATFDAVKRLATSRAVWVKLSATYRLDGGDPRHFAARWLDIVGPGRIVWGSDWPWTGHENAVEYRALRAALDDWIEPRLRAALLWDNPARLYQFD
jgi:predicted TIM-barrel fold metal-dependent hydrolase